MKTVVVKNENKTSVIDEMVETLQLTTPKTKIIKGKMFLSMYSLAQPNEGKYPPLWNEFERRTFKYQIKDALMKFGLGLDDILVCIWAYTTENDDLTGLGYGRIEEELGIYEELSEDQDKYEFWEIYFKGKTDFPGYLPLSILKDLEEGDILVLQMGGGYEIHLEAAQSKEVEFGRNNCTGRFEDRLKELIETGTMEPDYY